MATQKVVVATVVASKSPKHKDMVAQATKNATARQAALTATRDSQGRK